MEINLSPQHEYFLKDLVRKGTFTDIEAVIDEAVRRMIEQEAQLREEIRLGIEAADKGEFASFDVDEVIAEIVAEDS